MAAAAAASQRPRPTEQKEGEGGEGEGCGHVQRGSPIVLRHGRRPGLELPRLLRPHELPGRRSSPIRGSGSGGWGVASPSRALLPPHRSHQALRRGRRGPATAVVPVAAAAAVDFAVDFTVAIAAVVVLACKTAAASASAITAATTVPGGIRGRRTLILARGSSHVLGEARAPRLAASLGKAAATAQGEGTILRGPSPVPGNKPQSFVLCCIFFLG